MYKYAILYTLPILPIFLPSLLVPIYASLQTYLLTCYSNLPTYDWSTADLATNHNKPKRGDLQTSGSDKQIQ